MTDTLKVVVSDYDYGDVDIERSVVEAAGFELIAAQAKSEEELIAVGDASAILCQYAYVGAQTIAALPNLKVIARYGVGVDIVDVEAATRANVLVTNVRDYCHEEVADHAMAMMLAMVRKLRVYDRATRAGVWAWQAGRPVHRLRGATLGLLAFGVIAKEIVRRAHPFGLRILVHDPYVADSEITDEGCLSGSFKDVIEQADILMVQAPLTPETRGLIGEAELMRMKPTAYLINTARGPIVDNDALFKALSQKWIAGAALDDTVEEPAKRRSWQPDNPLFLLDNVYITPHAAYYSEESIAFCRRFAAEETVRVLRGERPLNPVNDVVLVNGTRSLPS